MVLRLQSPQLFDLRMSCLARRFASFQSTLAVLDQPDQRTAKRVIQAVYELPPAADCSDSEALLADVPPPQDINARARVAALRRDLAEVQALTLTEQFAESLPQAGALLERATDLDYGPVRAEIHNFMAYQSVVLGRDEEASEHVELASYQALRAGAFKQAAIAEMMALWTVGHVGRDFERAERHRRYAEALLEAAGNPPMEQARFHHMDGILKGSQGDFEGCAAETRKSLAIWVEHVPKSDPRITKSLHNIAICVGDPTAQGTEERLVPLREVAQRHRDNWDGPHPEVGLAVGNIGATLAIGGRYREAIVELEAALQIWRELGQMHDPSAEDFVTALANAYLAVGQPTQALATFGIDSKRPAVRVEACKRAVQVVQRATAVADAYIALGRIRDAGTTVDTALESCIAVWGDEHTDLFPLHTAAASVALESGSTETARVQLSWALASSPERGTSEITRQHSTYIERARLALLRGEKEKAIVQLEEELATVAAYTGPAHPMLTDVRHWLARAYQVADRPDEAAEQYAVALANLQVAVGVDNPRQVRLLLDMTALELARGTGWPSARATGTG